MIDRNGRPERPIITFQCREGQRRAAVNTLLLRTGQGYPKIAQEGREEGGPTDRQTGSAETTAVMKQTSSWRRVCENKAGLRFAGKCS